MLGSIVNLESCGAMGVDALFAAGDRVRLLHKHLSLNSGAVGTVTKQMTARRENSVSPDKSGSAVFVIFDGVIGVLTVPVRVLEKLTPE